MLRWTLILSFLGTLFMACNEFELADKSYQTKYVVLVVIDGARYSETWGDPSHQYIPNMDSAIAPTSCVHSQFYNNGNTYTTSGHTAMTTGFYQTINNSGGQLPDHPSFFQYWQKKNMAETNAAWIITSKDKLEVLANCADGSWNGSYQPKTDCGVSGLNSGYRHDSITVQKALTLMANQHPKLMLIQFRDPDYSAHTGDTMAYLNGIKSTDKYLYEVWKFIQSNPVYKNRTTLFVTNDHGRHLDGVSGGFASHGDGCDGCRRIHLLSYGPDFKKGFVSDTPRSLVDIHATICRLIGLKNTPSQGQVMEELFN